VRSIGWKTSTGENACARISEVETVTFETETWLKLRDRDFIKNSETETSKFVHFAEIFEKNVVITSKLNFFQISGIFRPVLVVSYLQIRQTEIEALLNHFFAIIKVSSETCSLRDRDSQKRTSIRHH